MTSVSGQSVGGMVGSRDHGGSLVAQKTMESLFQVTLEPCSASGLPRMPEPPFVED
jgi:pyrimidine deaminase RibD-like protein